MSAVFVTTQATQAAAIEEVVDRFVAAPESFSITDCSELLRRLQRPQFEHTREEEDLFDGLEPKNKILLFEAECVLEKLEEYRREIPRVYAKYHDEFTVAEKINLLRGLEYLDRIYPHLQPFSLVAADELEDLQAADDREVLQGDLIDEVKVCTSGAHGVDIMKTDPETTGVLLDQDKRYWAEWRAIELALLYYIDENYFRYINATLQVAGRQYIHELSDLERVLDEFLEGVQPHLPDTVSVEAQTAWKDAIVREWQDLTHTAGYDRGHIYYRIWPVCQVHFGAWDGPHNHPWAAASIWSAGEGGTCMFDYKKWLEGTERAQETLSNPERWHDHPDNCDFVRHVVPTGMRLRAGLGSRDDIKRRFVLHEGFGYSTYRPRILLRLVVDYKASDIRSWTDGLTDQERHLNDRGGSISVLLGEGIFDPKMFAPVYSWLRNPSEDRSHNFGSTLHYMLRAALNYYDLEKWPKTDLRRLGGFKEKYPELFLLTEFVGDLFHRADWGESSLAHDLLRDHPELTNYLRGSLLVRRHRHGAHRDTHAAVDPVYHMHGGMDGARRFYSDLQGSGPLQTIGRFDPTMARLAFGKLRRAHQSVDDLEKSPAANLLLIEELEHLARWHPEPEIKERLGPLVERKTAELDSRIRLIAG